MRPVDVIAKYAGAEIAVLLRLDDQPGNSSDLLCSLHYASIEHALVEIAEDLFDGRVERITANGRRLPNDVIQALQKH